MLKSNSPLKIVAFLNELSHLILRSQHFISCHFTLGLKMLKAKLGYRMFMNLVKQWYVYRQCLTCKDLPDLTSEPYIPLPEPIAISVVQGEQAKKNKLGSICGFPTRK